MTQEEALAILKTGASVFLTGEPGSGKTHTINRYVAYLRSYNIEPAITASTGIAATHIGGLTIHSWSGIGIRKELSRYDISRIGQNKNVVRRVSNVHVLVIDEVSMLSAQILSMVDAVCREIKRDNRPFGGLQVVFVGDFFQLPPVNRSGDRAQGQLSFERRSSHEAFAYTSTAWSALNPAVCHLSEQHRQEDPVFLEFLSSVRRKSVEERHRALLRTRYAPKPKNKITQLYSHNADVDVINNAELDKLVGKEKAFEMRGRGPEKLVAALKRGCLSPEVLLLKIGARVIFTKNDVGRYRYVNGTLGTVTGFSKNGGCPIVKTHAGKTILTEPDEWRMEDGGRILARITQVPLRLAWAMTVHKSQGMSLDAAHMDLSQTFEYGQGYVALSRVRTLNGLFLAGLNDRALEVHPEIHAQNAEFHARSNEVHQKFFSLKKERIAATHANFIRACGGEKPASRDSRVNTTKTHGPSLPKRGRKNIRHSRLEKTLALITEGKTVAETAKERGRTNETIIKHLETLKENGKFPVDACTHLSNGKEELFSDIEGVFVEIGDGRLKPVYEYLGGRVPYEIIRLARLLRS